MSLCVRACACARACVRVRARLRVRQKGSQPSHDCIVVRKGLRRERRLHAHAESLPLELQATAALGVLRSTSTLPCEYCRATVLAHHGGLGWCRHSHGMLQRVALRCNVLRYVATCCATLRCVAASLCEYRE